VQLSNCRFNGVKKPNIIKNVEGLKMKDVYINGELQ
jgi:hypothetical protein